MEIYLNYGKYWWWTTPLILLGLLSSLFVYIYWAIFVLCTLFLIFEINNPPKVSQNSSVTYYEQNLRLNILNFAIAIFLTLSNLLITLIPLIPKALLIAGFWYLGQFLVKKYAAQTLDYSHKSSLWAYLYKKVPEVEYSKIKNLVQFYFPDDLPNTNALAAKYGISLELAESLSHYYKKYLENNYS